MTATTSEITAQAQKVPVPLAEFLRYFLCSALALALDSLIYWVALRQGLAYQAAAAGGFVAGVSTAYVLSVRWVFRRRSVINAQVEFAIFLGVGIAGLGLTEALLWLQIDVFGFGPLTAKLCAAVGVFIFNFAARKLILFTRQSARAGVVVA
jgi:putative flippase GtrA